MLSGRRSLLVCARAALGLGALLSACTAGAYCRTTTCDVDSADLSCSYDSDGCATGGKSLFWPDSCGWFGVEKDGSKKLGISYDTVHGVVVGAFSKWSKANCGGTSVPSFAVADTDLLYGPVECPEHEFNLNAANASAWMFRDGDWPYVGATVTIALTTLSVELSTGRILDADVEINSYGTTITTSDMAMGADLDSIVTHEAGHFLGLAHSSLPTATMYAKYSGIDARSLAPDDEAGICAAYPPSKPPACGAPEPLYGFSKYCNGVNPSTQPEPSGFPDASDSRGAQGGDSSLAPRASGSGGGTAATPSDGSSCSVGFRPSSFGSALIGVLLLGTALMRRRRRASSP